MKCTSDPALSSPPQVPVVSGMLEAVQNLRIAAFSPRFHLDSKGVPVTPRSIVTQ